MKNSQDIQKELVDLAIAWGEAFASGNHRTANKMNSAIAKITKRFDKNKSLGETVLIPLLDNSNPSVRLMASVYTLEMGIHTQKAEAVLTSIAKDPNIRLIPMMAKINLSQWNEKKSQILIQKDENAG